MHPERSCYVETEENKTEVYYDESHAEVYHDEATDAVVGRLKTFSSGPEFREYMDTLIEATEDTGTDRMIADTSQFDSALTEEDQLWSAKDWAPRAQDAGLDHLAMVMPEQLVAEMTVDAIVDMTEDTINRGLFDNMSEAREWTRQQ